MIESKREFNDYFLPLLNDCYNMYTFLGRVFEKEITADFLEKIAEKTFAYLKIERLQEIPDEQLREGLKVLSRYLESLKNQDLKQAELELAVEYANLFLGVKGLPPPSESAYKSGLLIERATEEVLQAYWRTGVRVKVKEEFREPADHIAVELHFAAHLCRKAAENLEKGRKNEAERYLEARRDFLDKHLLSWVPSLTRNIWKTAETDFYKGLALITERFLRLDRALITYMLRELSK